MGETYFKCAAGEKIDGGYVSVSKYPRIVESGRKPTEACEKTNQGKPCVCCGKMTNGSKEIQVNWFRGEDESARVCSLCWKKPSDEIINCWKNRR